jgi:hypothetical protein
MILYQAVPAFYCCNVTELCNVEFLYNEFYIKQYISREFCIFMFICPTAPLLFYCSFSVALQPFGPWPIFQFLILYTVGRPHERGISPSQGRYLHTDIHGPSVGAGVATVISSMPRVDEAT